MISIQSTFLMLSQNTIFRINRAGQWMAVRLPSGMEYLNMSCTRWLFSTHTINLGFEMFSEIQKLIFLILCKLWRRKYKLLRIEHWNVDFQERSWKNIEILQIRKVHETILRYPWNRNCNYYVHTSHCTFCLILTIYPLN